jgi:hypothetical protein
MPICRHKVYNKLLKCSSLLDYIYCSHSDNINVIYESRIEKVTEALKIPIFYLPGTKLISQAITFGKEKPIDFYG